MLASRFLFVKNIIYFNHGIPYLGYKGITKFILYLIEKMNCLLATKIITVSHAMKIELEKITKIDVLLIYNGSASGIDLKQFKKFENNKSIIKIKYNISQKNKIILFVGRPNRRKGFHDIIEIWKKYFEFRSDYTLLLLGITEKDVLKLYKEIPNNLKAIPFTYKPEFFFIIADYLFMNSYHEGLNYSVLEAMLSKTIVISNNIFGASEIINNNVNGFLIDNNCHRSFFNTVMLCEESKVLKKRITEKGSNTVKKYNHKAFLKDYEYFLLTF
jgi:glycosyltransferase involved in cell wall biosynthesis